MSMVNRIVFTMIPRICDDVDLAMIAGLWNAKDRELAVLKLRFWADALDRCRDCPLICGCAGDQPAVGAPPGQVAPKDRKLN